MKTSTLGFLMIAAVVLCASVAAVSGAYRLDAQQVVNLIAGTDSVPMQDKIVFWQIRLPRILAALLLGAALCWFCAEGALSRRAALGEGTAAAALPALRTVMAAAVAYTAVYRFCTLFAMEPYLQGMNPSLYYTVSRLVQFWM